MTANTKPCEEFLSDCIDELSRRESDPGHPHWFSGEGDDEGLSYCLTCVKELRPDAHFGIDLSGGYPGYAEADGAERCEKCGRLLTYTLTDYGLRDELAHFVEDGFDWNNADDCFELSRVAHGIYKNKKQELQLLGVLKRGLNFPDTLKGG